MLEAQDVGPFRRRADCVVLCLEKEQQSQWTVVTETSGPLEGKRVVRGREAECRRYYERSGDL